jgi:glycerate kinase
MTRVKEKLILKADESVEALEAWTGELGELRHIVEILVDKYGIRKKLIVDGGYSNVSFMIDNSDVRAIQQAEWEAKHPKKLTKGKLDEHKNKVIIDLLKHAGVKLTNKEINERITTGKGFGDLLNK